MVQAPTRFTIVPDDHHVPYAGTAEDVGGVTFGWVVQEFEGEYSINIEPGNFIAYYEPWDGLGYDT
jgi:hypothetical protein